MTQPRQYILTLFIGLALMLVGSCALTFLVDPYGPNGRPSFAPLKTEADRHLAEAKWSRFVYSPADTVLIGNSRVDVGFRPPSDQIFNFGVPGARIEQMVAISDMILKEGRTQKLLFGVDYFDFCDCVSSDAPQPLLPETPREQLKQFVVYHLSLASLNDSLRTMFRQQAPGRDVILNNGFNDRKSYTQLIEREGHSLLFKQKIEEMRQRLTSKDWQVERLGENPSGHFAALEREMLAAANHRIDLVIFTYPYHRTLHQLICDTGQSVEFLNWKMDVVRSIKRFKSENPQAQIVFYDFANLSEMANEAIPETGDRKSQMNWYWEAGHFKATFGDLMLERMFASEGSTAAAGDADPDPDFKCFH